jgi:hypothetical protein
MATATKAGKGRRKAQRQQLIEQDDEPIVPQIPELEDLGEEFEDVRGKRIALNAEEDELQTKVAEVMRKHKIEAYRLGNGHLMLLQHEEKDRVKIKKPDEDKKGRKKKGTEADFGDN